VKKESKKQKKRNYLVVCMMLVISLDVEPEPGERNNSRNMQKVLLQTDYQRKRLEDALSAIM
jgi:hypothetical protein